MKTSTTAKAKVWAAPHKLGILILADEREAMDRMRWRNQAAIRAGNRSSKYMFAVVPKDDQWAVVDLPTAIDMGIGYRWSV